jgi:hypothetical protein
MATQHFVQGLPHFTKPVGTAGMPEQVYQHPNCTQIYGYKLTADMESWLNDTKQLAEKVAAICAQPP